MINDTDGLVESIRNILDKTDQTKKSAENTPKPEPSKDEKFKTEETLKDTKTAKN